MLGHGRTNALLAAAAGALVLVGLGHAAAPQDGGLVRFTNGQVADASEVNANFELLDEARAQVAARVDDLEARVPADLVSRLEALEAGAVALQAALDQKDQEIVLLQGEVDALTATTADLGLALDEKDQEVAALQEELADLASTQGVAADTLVALEGVLTDSGLLDELGDPVEASLEVLRELLLAASVEDLATGAGDTARTLRLTGVNLQVVSGAGATDAPPNGVGNVIIGYNEFDAQRPDEERTGSHNLVLGLRNSYLQVGGLVAGVDNVLEGPFATITGGYQNVADGANASIAGGSFNVSSGEGSTVAGGRGNEASGVHACVGGGAQNEASGDFSVVGGGRLRTAPGDDDWAAGSLLEDD